MSISKIVEDKLKEEAQNRADDFWDNSIKNVASSVLSSLERCDCGFKVLMEAVEAEVKCIICCEGGEVPEHETPLPVFEHFQEEVAEEFVNKSVNRKKRKKKSTCSYCNDKNCDGDCEDDDDDDD